MALGAHDALGTQLECTLLITKDGHVPPEGYKLPRAEVIESSHPVPDSRSLSAGERLLQWVEELPASVQPVFLVSGGASSLVEALIPGQTLEDLQRLNKDGLASALSIEALNERRREISRIKGGRLASKLRGRGAQAFFISDVPGDHPAVIGSGLLGPAPDGPDDVARTVIASIDHAMHAARERATELGLRVKVEPTRYDQEADRLAVRFTHELSMDAIQVRIWGGESVMRLPAQPGRGGRNQHLALAAARLIAGYEELALLAAGTDGTDGPTTDAGAIVDSNTCARLALADLDVDDCLRRADSGTALEATGDLIHTGPTGTNVGDLVIGLKLSETDARAVQHRTRLRHSSRGSPVL
jgi:hydroxypyruvate reductase